MKWKFSTVFPMAIENNRQMPGRVILSTVASILVTSVVACVPLKAQIDSARSEMIAVVARPSEDSITIRWAPLTYSAWRKGNSEGYRLERYVISRNGRLIPTPEKAVLDTAIRPWKESLWERLAITSKYGGIAAQALFGERFEADLSKSGILSIVSKAKENEQRFAFALFCADMSPSIARASGLWFTDKTNRAGERYLYRVMVNGPEQIQGSVFTGNDAGYHLPKPQNLKAEFRDYLVSLRWDRIALNPYTAFVVERSDNGRDFTKTSDTPLVTLSPDQMQDNRYEYALDSLPGASGTYHYRIKGITPFGEEGPPSDVVSGRAAPSVDQAPYIVSAQNINNKSILLEWSFPETGNSAIRGFRIERSAGPQGRYIILNHRLIPPEERTFEDTSPGQVNYYRVLAQALHGEQYPSHVYYAQLVDSIPPHVPSKLNAIVNDSGQVFLAWSPNTDPDIYGYRIYKSYHQSEEAVQVTGAPITAHTFTDHVDLNTLNENVYYRLMAVDVNQNHSALSDPLRVSLPDKVKPQPPVILPNTSDTSGVLLSWIAGASEDITAYKVYRRLPGEPGWFHLQTLAANPDSVYTYVDLTCPPATPAYYTVLSVDDAGLESDPAEPVSRVDLPMLLSAPVRWKNHRIVKEENQVMLAWTFGESGVDLYRIFRSVNNAPPMLLKSLPSTTREFVDSIIPGNFYRYRITACFKNGRKSALSDELKFEY